MKKKGKAGTRAIFNGGKKERKIALVPMACG